MTLRKIVYSNEGSEVCATSGIHPNAFPHGWKEISVQEFSRSPFFTYSPAFMEYRQMHDTLSDGTIRHGSGMTAAKLFHFSDGTGIAMSNTYWDEKVRYFKFGCDHKYIELMPSQCREEGVAHFGMCYHVYKCSECNHVMSQDSSD